MSNTPKDSNKDKEISSSVDFGTSRLRPGTDKKK